MQATTAATCALNEDTNAAAAKEKAKRRDVMSKSQENKNEKTSVGDDEMRRLVEEWRNAAKGEKHKLKELRQEDQKLHQGKKKTKRQETIQQILE